MPRERSFDVAAFCVHIYQPTNESTDLRNLEAIKQALVGKIVHEYSNRTPPDHIHKCITSGIPVASISTAFDISEKGAFEPGFKEIDSFMVPWKSAGQGFKVIGKYANRQQPDHRQQHKQLSRIKRALRGPVVSRDESGNSGASDAEGEISSSGTDGLIKNDNNEMAGGTDSEPDAYYSCVSRRLSHVESMTGSQESSRERSVSVLEG